MDNASYIALSRMIAQQHVLDTRASNIANMTTPGYKAGSVVFSDFLVSQSGVDGVPGERNEQMVQDRATYRDFSQGDISKTGNSLDFALQSTGFFVVETPRGERYTRAGRFSLSANSQIVDLSGSPVQGSDGRPLTVPPGDTHIIVNGDGSVSSESGQIGKLKVVDFEDPQVLQAEGETQYSSTAAARPVDKPGVVQGAIEAANVKAVVELARMMAEMREFEFASQFVDGETQRQQSAIDHILRPS